MDKSTKEKMLSVIYETTIEGGYIAYVPSLPGCYSQGETLDEVKKNIKEAIELYIEEKGNIRNLSFDPIIGTVMVHA